jgi:AcrR family transcriptional regulator
MARVVKDYQTRYHEILDTAQQFFFTKGYETSTVNEMINSIDIAKGTFYHYFNSKEELLLAVVARMADQIINPIRQIFDSESLSGKEKFEKIFMLSGSWKVDNVDTLKPLLRVMFQDENALLRDKMNEQNIARMSPILAEAIQQAVEEGDFVNAYPDETAHLILNIGVALTKDLAMLLLEIDENPQALEIMKHKVKVYEYAVERLVGAEPGSLKIVDRTVIRILEKFLEK